MKTLLNLYESTLEIFIPYDNLAFIPLFKLYFKALCWVTVLVKILNLANIYCISCNNPFEILDADIRPFFDTVPSPEIYPSISPFKNSSFALKNSAGTRLRSDVLPIVSIHN